MEYILTEETYAERLAEYLDIFTEFLSTKITGDSPEEIKTIIVDLLIYAKTPNIFLKPDSLDEVQNVCQQIDTLALDNTDIKNNAEFLKKVFRIAHFDGNIEEYISNIQEQDIDISNSLNEIRDSMDSDGTLLAQKMKQIATTCLEAVVKTQNQ